MVCFAGRKALSFDLDKRRHQLAWIWPPRSTLYLQPAWPRMRCLQSQCKGEKWGKGTKQKMRPTASMLNKEEQRNIEDGNIFGTRLVLAACIFAFLGSLWLQHVIVTQTAHCIHSYHSSKPPRVTVPITVINSVPRRVCAFKCMLPSTALFSAPGLVAKEKWSGASTVGLPAEMGKENGETKRSRNQTERIEPKSASKSDVEKHMDCHDF